MFLNIFHRNKDQIKEKSLFWDNENQLNKLTLKTTINRVAKTNKNDLIFDPIGFEEWIYLASMDINKLKKLLYDKYFPKPQITLSMPKGNYTFRPVSYLLPSDSIIYQAIVDKLIMHKRDKFSNQVYSNIINKIELNDVFDKPVSHWLRMMNNIREQYHKGHNHYFFADISGYYENIKINQLLSTLTFYTGRNEKEFETLLEKLLIKWQFAKSQGLIQPHNASSILSKIYLTPVDSALSHLKGQYSRYVDEFHIITYAEKELLLNILNLCEKLRELGLNLNSSKSKYIEGNAIHDEINEDRDFFNCINYLEFYLGDFNLLQIEIDTKFDSFISNFENGEHVNMKIFRSCIRRYARDENPRAIDFCLRIINKNFDQIVDIVKYLSVFMKDKLYSEIILKKITNYIENIENNEQNYYHWVQCWLLNLYIKTDYEEHINKELLKKIFMNKNQNNLSRATALLAYSKHSNDFDLIFLKDIYHDTDNILFKRSVLAAASKMPRTYTKDMYSIDISDELDIIVLKEYLLNNEYKIETRI